MVLHRFAYFCAVELMQSYIDNNSTCYEHESVKEEIVMVHTNSSKGLEFK